MKTLDDIIDEIILKNPYGNRLWKERMKKRYTKKDEAVINEEKEEVQHMDHPKQTYIKFED